MQPWYSNNTGLVRNFSKIKYHLGHFMKHGSSNGYFHDLTKIVLVVSEIILQWAKELFRGMGNNVITGSYYLGRFIGNKSSHIQWLYNNLKGWLDIFKPLVGAVIHHIQAAYVKINNYLQQEWKFLQRINLGMVPYFCHVG